MKHIINYLKKYEINQSSFGKLSTFTPDIIIVIPAYKERHILETLYSLLKCSIYNFKVEVLVYVNGRETDGEVEKWIHEQNLIELKSFVEQYSNDKIWFRFYGNLNLNKKQSGVGKARKYIMDDAIWRLTKYKNFDGIIVNLDADTKVSQNYLKAIIDFYQANPKAEAISIHFEHSLTEHLDSIINYELHLRYFIGMQRIINLPFAFQTIGSAMAVRASAYAKMGGMPQREAGEDFYFLHKFSKVGTLMNLTNATVFPSSRMSDRVPFGTGRAIMDSQINGERLTYNYKSFEILYNFLKNIQQWFHHTDSIKASNKALNGFLEQINFHGRLIQIRKNTSNEHSFVKRFYQYFDAFQFMKYLHWMRDVQYKDISIEHAAQYYGKLIGLEYLDKMDFLTKLRNYDKISGAQP